MYSNSDHRRLRRHGAVAALIALAALAVAPSSGRAFSVQPLLMELAPLGGASRASMSVTNANARAVTIEALPMRLAHDGNGREVLTDAEDELLVFPPVAIVQPGSAQTLQVQYIGDPELAVSGTYRVLVQNVPVSLEGGEDGRTDARASASRAAGVGVASPGHPPGEEVATVRVSRPK